MPPVLREYELAEVSTEMPPRRRGVRPSGGARLHSMGLISVKQGWTLGASHLPAGGEG